MSVLLQVHRQEQEYQTCVPSVYNISEKRRFTLVSSIPAMNYQRTNGCISFLLVNLTINITRRFASFNASICFFRSLYFVCFHGTSTLDPSKLLFTGQLTSSVFISVFTSLRQKRTKIFFPSYVSYGVICLPYHFQ